MFLLDLYQGIGGPLTCLFVYKSAKNILSVLYHWCVSKQDKFSCRTRFHQEKKWQKCNKPFKLATTNAQLAILPTFSNNPKEDNSPATEWLQKLLNNKQEAGWTDIQTVTHFRNAIRGEVLKWYNAQPLVDVDNLEWENVKTQFENDFHATPTVSLVIQKLPEIRQKDNATVIQYTSRCAEILLEL